MNGILNIYKEQGYTSHDVVAILRRILKTKRIGHTGTLDPNAEGVLPICIGQATKLSELLMEKRKSYTAEFCLGKITDTQDVWGQVIAESPVKASPEEVEQTVFSFVGEINQIPPMYSAIKQDGKKLYELAREGKEVERKPRPTVIYEICDFMQIKEKGEHCYRFTVVCAKGTYIRTLCHDIGQKLGCGAYMTALIRTRSGNFGLDTALKLAEVESLQAAGELNAKLISVDKALTIPHVRIEESFQKWLYAGNPIPLVQVKDAISLSDQQLYYVHDHADRLIGIYRRTSEVLKVMKFLYQPSEESMIIKNTDENWSLSEIAVILGNFDGIHRGHHLLVEKANILARKKGLKTAVLTFTPHPQKFFVGEKFRLIYTEKEKIALFAEIGVDYYILFPFTEDNRNMSPEQFVNKILRDRLGAKAVVVGEDYRFGKQATGNAALLKKMLSPQGIEVSILEKLQDHGEDISSTRLRAAIEIGDLNTFTELTGRDFHIRGVVVNGQKLGRELGFPTANLLPPTDKILPPNGVYITEVLFQGKSYHALSNVGISPSLENRPYSVETFILEFDENIYGKEIEIRFREYLRPEIRFAGIDQLKEQIAEDVARVRKKFADSIC